jgi:beta-glucosidase
VEPFAATSILEGISNYLGTAVSVYYARGLPSLGEMADATSFSTEPVNGQPGLSAEYFNSDDLQGTPSIARLEQHINFRAGSRAEFPAGTLSSRWTGYYVVKQPGNYDIFVASSGEDGGYYRLYVDGKLVFDSWAIAPTAVSQARVALDAAAHKIRIERHGRSRWIGSRFQFGISRTGTLADAEAKKLAASADVVVLAVGFDPGSESEGADRTFSLPPGQDQLIEEITAANKNTIVVLTSGGNVAMNAWLDRVPALIEMWYPGQEGGRALAEVLFGEVNPSGRLPVTFERRWEDNPVHDSYYPAAGTKRVVYKEGVFVGYRGYGKTGTKPLFPFGYGLSYTTFKYSNLEIKTIANGDSTNPRYEVSFDVKNTGSNEGADVAQVYVGDTHARVPRPAKELKGFTKVSLRAGETRRVTVPLDGRALTYYDANRKLWRADAGDFEVLVGRSSEQIELRGKLTLPNALTIENGRRR